MILGTLFTIMWFILLITIAGSFWFERPLVKFLNTDLVLFNKKIRAIILVESLVLIVILCLMFATKR